jgi:transcriptional regulator with XRE-family HTH domain
MRRPVVPIIIGSIGGAGLLLGAAVCGSRIDRMVIGDRMRALREEKNLSQGDIEKRAGLLRCDISRVENGHTTPSIETLEKLARALDIPMYQLFYDGEETKDKCGLAQCRPRRTHA